MKRFTRGIAPILGVLLLLLSLSAASAVAADKYVALGDSYSAGNGANSTNLNSSCNRNTYAYPYLLSQQKGYALTFVACSGAVTGDVINSQVNSITSDTKLVTITIGGNDIGFTNLIIACTTLGCSSQIASSQNQINTQLPAKLDATYNAIRAKSATAQVVVLGYGRPFASPPRTCLAATGVSSSEETSLTTLVDSLNTTIKTRALAHGFSYADVNPYWAGHDVCASNPFTNGLTIFHTADSYHPTRNGYASGDVPAIRAIVG
jgi:lysophospholipase L1-like esterase